MINLITIWVVEFSLRQKCFHVSTMDEVIRNNLEGVLRRHQGDWMVIGVFDNELDAHNHTDTCRKRLKIDQYVLYRDTQGNMQINNEQP